jgi:hypothetical protein
VKGRKRTNGVEKNKFHKKERIMMKNFAIKSFSILAIFLISFMPLAFPFMVKSAEALVISVQWGHLETDYDEDEKDAEEDLCDYIYWLFYYDDYDNNPTHSGNWGVSNAWWVYTDTSGVATCMNWQNDPDNYIDFVTNWWVGDYFPGFPPPNPFGHLWFWGDSDNVSDTQIHYYATGDGSISSKQKFDFIWTCANGGLYWYNDQGAYYNIQGIMYPVAGDPETPPGFEPTNTNDEYGFFYSGDAVGMPLAWTGTSSMNLNGYTSTTGSYCYIGFEGRSPFMINDLPETEVQVDNFPKKFYEYALGYWDTYYYPYCEHQTISASLDYASENTFGASFDETPFYTGYWEYLDEDEAPPGADGWWWVGHMRVFGKGNMVLPNN